MESIEKIVDELQKSFDKGWREFKQSSLFKKYNELANMLDWYNPRIANLRKSIPYPAYHLATQEIGKYFMIKSKDYGIYFDEVFPGDFNKSNETKENNLELRHFKLSVYHNNNLLGFIKISIPHSHDKFDILAPPKISFRSVNKKQYSGKI
ncbi:MAG: hypothetical protein AABX77_01630 [Nanoarchaeota archaeon]